MNPKARFIAGLIAGVIALAIAGAAAAETGDDHAARGIEYSRAGEYESAIKELRAALAMGLKNYPAKLIHTLMGNAHAELNRTEKAMAAYKKALELDPEYHVAWVNLGVAYRISGDYENAGECYNKALQIEPDYAPLQVSLGALYLLRRQPEKAVGHLERAVELDPGLAAGHANLALAYATTGRFKEAEKSMKQAAVLGYQRTDILKARIEELKNLQ